MHFNGRLSALCLHTLPFLLAVFLGSLAPAAAQVVREPDDPLAGLATVDSRLRTSTAATPFEGAAAGLPSEVRDEWQGFLATAGGPWKGYVDRRTGRIDYAEGAGLPWIAGAGNSLEAHGTPGLQDLEAIARSFLPRVATALGVDPDTLVLSKSRSGRTDSHLWNVDFDVVLDGMTVEGARVVLRINNGNLIQFGTENLPAPGSRVPAGRVGRKEALATFAGYVGGMSAADQFLDGGTARLIPAVLEESDGERGVLRVWEFTFRRRGSMGTWRARVDAASGLLLEFRDVNAYAKANGGVYPKSYIFNDETVLPMPYADLSTGGFTDSAGNFPGSGTVSSTLTGQYVDINDSCGSISLTSNALGSLLFGTSTGTDCTTPGSGGAGNTHSARTQFYHVNRAKEIGRGWLPSNTWLNAQLPVNVNIQSVCNAYWDGFSVNFFRSGSGCGNTGEIAAVSLHEYGHGLDSNDGNGFSADNGTGEGYADITAALLLHDSCMGQGFRTTNCAGYGDACTSCTGVRDVDWAKHTSNTAHTVENFTRVRCPGGGGYDGPCGGEGHCESYVMSEAVWDLANRDLPTPGSAAAWATTERLWYVSRPTSTSAFVCHNSTIPWTSDGCAAGALFRTLRAADDDDGNLANGTPHSCQIFAALNRHGMACAGDPGANTCFSGCTPPAVPTLGATPGNRQVALSWSGATAGAEFDVFRSEAGCNSGFVRIASGLTGASFTDLAVANGLTYSYRLVSHGAGNAACSAAPTECQSAMPQEPPCDSPPSAPANLVATSGGIDRINLSWNAVPGASEYRVFRATSAAGPFTQIASLPAATTYSDGNLDPGTIRYYRVRAATGDNCVSTDSNTAGAGTTPCQTETLYQSGFEGPNEPGLAGWTVENFTATTSSWRGVQACQAHGGNDIFRFGGQGCSDFYTNGEHSGVWPPGDGALGFAIPAGAGLNRLSFWHSRSFEYGYDGGTLKISVDGGPWVQVPASALSGYNYDRTVYNSCPPPGVVGTPVFTGISSGFVQTTVNLDTACVAAGSATGCGGHSIRVSFETITDCVVSSYGWYLDDVNVSTCVPHACTGAPVIGTATTPANNQVQLSWSNGTPASSSFNVYRALGTCAAHEPFTRVANAVAGSPYLDSPVSGGVTWAYSVTGLDSTGFCESDPSGCVQASPTGACTVTPTFAGVAEVEDQVSSTCALAITWAPANAHCGGPATYDVFRSTDPGFVPSAANRIATGLTGTSFQDTGALNVGTTYYYIVRSKDTANGQVDTNLVRLFGTPTGPLVLPVTLTDTFEAADGFDLDGWTYAALSGTNTWERSQSAFHSGTHSWHSVADGYTSHRVLVSPTITAGGSTVLSFWHTYRFESCFDGGLLDISVDGGPWTYLSGTAFISGGYTGQIYNSGNPLGGLKAWCEGTIGTMTQVRVDLSPWAGHEVQVRWHMGEDSSYALEGWYIDTVSFENAVVENVCHTTPPPTDFYTAAPCRLVDTREPNAPNGGPALFPGQTRTFVLTGSCGIPATAKALSVNITAVGAGAGGNLSLFPADQAPPITSSINFLAGQNRANNAILPLSPAGAIQVKSNTSAPVHLLLDVNGWFQE
ncbi:MAG TPA: hypothetical protein VH394_18130 [Thermoanaerobaculia bacterium]|nr:hypothetical protein [Thermoanaerobaculia bacterium]